MQTVRGEEDTLKKRDAIQRLKERVYDKDAAAEVRRIACNAPNTFDRQAFLNLVQDHPIFSKLHLVSDDE